MSAIIKEFQPLYFILRQEGLSLNLQYQGEEPPVIVRNNQLVMLLSEKETERKIIFIEGRNTVHTFQVGNFSNFVESGIFTGGGILDPKGHWQVSLVNEPGQSLTVSIQPSESLRNRRGSGRIKALLPITVFTNSTKREVLKRLQFHLEYHFLSLGVDD